jgi:predicted amidohydrolase
MPAGTGTVRVAAAQLAVGADVEENLASCLRVIRRASAHRPQLLVLPEFVNHLSWYESAAHCHAVSVALDGPFVRALGAAAAEHGLYLVASCTVQRAGGRTTATSLLFDPRGQLRATADKQVLMGHENDVLGAAEEVAPVVETPVGRLGLYACMDGVIAETPRSLALRGAQILCNSLNSFASDEAALHVPVRAAENRVFVVAANKVGPLIPEPLLDAVSQATSIPVPFLMGAGESQIVGPDGTVLARASRDAEEVVWADIEPALASRKTRPDGTDLFRARRPALYGPITSPQPPEVPDASTDEVRVAIHQPEQPGTAGVEALAQALAQGAAAEAQLLLLPQLFGLEEAELGDVARCARRCDDNLAALRAACPAGLLIATSVVERHGDSYRHTGVLFGARGERLHQPQLHFSARMPWAAVGDELHITRMPWGRLALVVGDDALYPELFRTLALAGVSVVLVPMSALEAWELALGLPERAAENRMCLAAASRDRRFGAGLLADLPRDFTLMTPWIERRFDGTISTPVLTPVAPSGFSIAALHPDHARNKVISRGTDLLGSRPWRLSEAITAAPRSASGARS